MASDPPSGQDQACFGHCRRGAGGAGRSLTLTLTLTLPLTLTGEQVAQGAPPGVYWITSKGKHVLWSAVEHPLRADDTFFDAGEYFAHRKARGLPDR